MARTPFLAALLATLSLSSPLASAAAVSISQALTPGWSTAYCSPCAISSVKTRYFASFSVEDAATFSGASFAVSQNPLLGDVTSFSVSVWSAPIDGTLLYEALFDPGEYTRIGLSVNQPGRGFVEVLLPDWFLNPGDYWISLYAPGASISWGSDGRTGDDRGYSLNNGVWQELSSDPYLGFSLRGRSDPSAVPIGSTLPLLLTGIASLALVRRRSPVAH